MRPANRTFAQRSTTVTPEAENPPEPKVTRISEDDEVNLNGTPIKLPPVPSTGKLFEVVPDRVPKQRKAPKQNDVQPERAALINEPRFYVDERL